MKGIKTKPQIIAILLAIIVSIAFLSACSSVTVAVDKPGSQIQTIEKEAIPLTAPEQTAAAEATFENGTDVDRTEVSSGGSVTINRNLDDKGIIGIKADIKTEKKLKIKVSKDAQALYYDIAPQEMAKIPLQLGNGAYKLELYENLQDTAYRQLFEKEVDVSLAEESSVFLYSNQVVNFDGATLSAGLSASLTKGQAGSMAKLTAIYQYVVANIVYDYEKINGLDASYIPNADDILRSGRGICYDYAAVTAVMLRESGVPAKLVKGYRDGLKEYHAWNEVFINGDWLTVDATFDASAYKNGESYEMIKDSAQYTVEKVF